MDIESEQMSLKEIEGILESYRRKRKFFRLPDGSFLQLEDNGLSAVAELAEPELQRASERDEKCGGQ